MVWKELIERWDILLGHIYADALTGSAIVDRSVADYREGAPSRADGFVVSTESIDQCEDDRIKALYVLAEETTLEGVSLLRHLLGEFVCVKCGAKGPHASMIYLLSTTKSTFGLIEYDHQNLIDYTCLGEPEKPHVEGDARWTIFGTRRTLAMMDTSARNVISVWIGTSSKTASEFNQYTEGMEIAGSGCPAHEDFGVSFIDSDLFVAYRTSGHKVIPIECIAEEIGANSNETVSEIVQAAKKMGVAEGNSLYYYCNATFVEDTLGKLYNDLVFIGTFPDS